MTDILPTAIPDQAKAVNISVQGGQAADTQAIDSDWPKLTRRIPTLSQGPEPCHHL